MSSFLHVTRLTDQTYIPGMYDNKKDKDTSEGINRSGIIIANVISGNQIRDVAVTKERHIPSLFWLLLPSAMKMILEIYRKPVSE